MTLHELHFGVALLPTGNRRRRLEEWLEAFETTFEGAFLSIEREEAELAARLRSAAKSEGRVLHLGDA